MNWRRRVPSALPTRRLAAALALVSPLWLLSGSSVGAAAAMLATGLVLLAALLDWLAIPGVGEVKLVRELPPTIGLGDEVAARVGIAPLWAGGARPRWAHRLRFQPYDDLPRSLQRASALPVLTLAGDDSHSWVDMTLKGAMRGVWSAGPMALRGVGPLGLAQRTLHYGLSDEVTIAPSLEGVRSFRLLSLQHRLRDLGVRALRRRGEGQSFSSLREYVIGDEPRRLDWKATARRQRLMVREFSVEQGQTVVIAVDSGRMMTQLAGGVTRFEHALSAATILADIAIQSGDQVGLLVFDDEVRAFVPPARGGAALKAMREALIPVQPRMTEPDYGAAFRLLATRHRRRSLIILFTDVIDSRASQSLMSYLARSAARHLPVVVALRNDALVAAAAPLETASAFQLYESAAAEELLLARNDALLRMRRSGVAVLDVSPQVMTAAVINRYLEIKARASL